MRIFYTLSVSLLLLFGSNLLFGAGISGQVWQDDNGDNQFTFGEPRLSNIRVYQININGDTLLSTLTGMDGKYSFTNILPGDYKVAFELDSLPSDYSVVLQNFGSDDSIDSDVDSLGVSDTISLIAGSTINFLDMGVAPAPITVLNTDTIYLDMDKNGSLLICLDTTELIGNVQSAQVLSPPTNGVLTNFSGNCFTYIPNTNYVGIDQFLVIVCDDLSNCDTTLVNMNVIGLFAILPVAVNDIDTVVQGKPTQLQVLSNDTLFAPLTSLRIIDYPSLGSAEADSFGFIRYIPEPDICDEMVSLTYEICTQFGCDTGVVTVFIECDRIQVVDAFSPNGDGINENFVIKGIANYPDNRLIIFNRWGNKVFEQEKYDNSWSGDWNDSALSNGTYFYIFDKGDGSRLTGYFLIFK